MKMKLLIVGIALLAVGLVFAACVVAFEPGGGVVADPWLDSDGAPFDGPLSGFGSGYGGGRVTVNLVLLNGEIQTVAITQMGQTALRIERLMRDAPGLIQRRNGSPIVESFSGATLTRDAINVGLARALDSIP